MAQTDFDPLQRLRDAKEPAIESKLIHPTVGFTIKTTDSNRRKVFVNVCSSPDVAAPSGWNDGKTPPAVASALDRLHLPDGHEDADVLRFSMSADGGREDTDHTGAPCLTVDCTINSSVIAHAEHVRQFKTFVIVLILDYVGKKLDLTLDKTSYKLPRMRYKASASQPAPVPQLIRKEPHNLVTEIEEKPSKPGFALRLEKKSSIQRSATPNATAAPLPTTSKVSAPSREAATDQQQAGSSAGISHTIQYEGSPAEAACIEIKLPGDIKASNLTVSSCCEDVYVQVGKETLKVSLPFGVDAASAAAKLTNVDQKSSRLFLRLPYQSYTALLQPCTGRAAVAAH